METLPTGIAPPYYINFINCKKRLDRGEEIESEPMYTHHPGGYKFKLKLDQRRYFFPTFTTLECHHEPVNPVPMHITLVIVNQQTRQDHYVREVRVQWLGYGTETSSTKNEDLESRWKAGKEYLRNDCMEYKITQITIM